MPPNAALIATMRTAAAAVTVADRRAIEAKCASIFWELRMIFLAGWATPARRKVGMVPAPS
jgi:hypothetical protein